MTDLLCVDYMAAMRHSSSGHSGWRVRVKDHSDEADEIVEWLSGRNVKYCIFLEYATFADGLIVLLLPEDAVTESVYLAMMSTCVSVAAI